MVDLICMFVFFILVLVSIIIVLKDFFVLFMEGRSDFIIILGLMFFFCIIIKRNGFKVCLLLICIIGKI